MGAIFYTDRMNFKLMLTVCWIFFLYHDICGLKIKDRKTLTPGKDTNVGDDGNTNSAINVRRDECPESYCHDPSFGVGIGNTFAYSMQTSSTRMLIFSTVDSLYFVDTNFRGCSQTTNVNAQRKDECPESYCHDPTFCVGNTFAYSMQTSSTRMLIFSTVDSLYFVGYQFSWMQSNHECKCPTKGRASALANLTATVLLNYDAGLRPSCTGNEPVQVDVNMAVGQLISLNEPEQIAKFSMWMRMKWTDCRISWDPNDFEGATEFVIPIEYVWKPDLTLYESVAEEFYGFDEYRSRISHDGTVRYNFPTLIEAVCRVDVLKFPYDKQICRLTFGSWIHHGFELNVFSSKESADISSLKENVEWVIEGVPCTRHVVVYGCCPEPYPDVSYYVIMRRKPASYVTNIIIPSILITLLSSLGFFLPVDSGEKIGLQLTVMLAIFVFQVLVSDHLPPSANSTPWICFFLSFTLALCGIACLLQVFVLNIHFRQNDMPYIIKIYILRPLARMTFLEVPELRCKAKCAESLRYSDKPEEDEQEEGDSLWTYMATAMDRMGFFIFIMAFLIGSIISFDGMISE